jgi:TatD DNase family protein
MCGNPGITEKEPRRAVPEDAQAVYPAGSMPPLVDCHIHLQDESFADDLPAVLGRAADAGVSRFACNGSSIDDWPAVTTLARKHAQIIPCFGVHPWYVGQQPVTWLEELRRCLLSMPGAVGEIGLDRWIDPRDEPLQERFFRQQLAIARELNRPVMVHCLRAWGWLLDVLKVEPPPAEGMLIHAFGGSAEMIRPLANMGAYFSFAGNVLEPRRWRAREALAAVPVDRLLIETDSPDLPPPKDFRSYGQARADGRIRNEPANLPRILRGIAQVRHADEAQLAEAIWQNASRLFGVTGWKIDSPESGE